MMNSYFFGRVYGDLSVPARFDGNVSIEVAESDIPALKATAKKIAPWMTPPKRLEALARSYGFRSAAAMQAHIKAATPKSPAVLEPQVGVPSSDHVDFAFNIIEKAGPEDADPIERLKEVISLGTLVNSNIQAGRTKRGDWGYGKMIAVAPTTCITRRGGAYGRPEAIPASFHDLPSPMLMHDHGNFDHYVLFNTQAKGLGPDIYDLQWRKVGTSERSSVSPELAPFLKRNSARWHFSSIPAELDETAPPSGLVIVEVEQNQVFAEHKLDWNLDIRITRALVGPDFSRVNDNEISTALAESLAAVVVDHLDSAARGSAVCAYYFDEKIDVALRISLQAGSSVVSSVFDIYYQTLAARLETYSRTGDWLRPFSPNPLRITLADEHRNPYRWDISPMAVFAFPDAVRDNPEIARKARSWSDLEEAWIPLEDNIVPLDDILPDEEEKMISDTYRALIESAVEAIKIGGSLHMRSSDPCDIEVVLRVSVMTGENTAESWRIGSYGPPGQMEGLVDQAMAHAMVRLGLPLHHAGGKKVLEIHAPDRMEPIIMLRTTDAFREMLGSLTPDQETHLRSRLS